MIKARVYILPLEVKTQNFLEVEIFRGPSYQNSLGAIHQGRPTDPSEGGSQNPDTFGRGGGREVHKFLDVQN